jgi:hypothetical protein
MLVAKGIRLTRIEIASDNPASAGLFLVGRTFAAFAACPGGCAGAGRRTGQCPILRSAADLLGDGIAAKFAETIQEALGRQPERPVAMEGIEVAATLRSDGSGCGEVKAYIFENVPQ